MTRDAQSALRRTMETYTKVTRFCIICNYVTRIIEPITSRCAKFRYKPLSTESMSRRLEEICAGERVALAEAEKPGGEGTLDAIMALADGDMRKSITLLQTANRLVGKGEKLARSHVFDAAGTGPATERACVRAYVLSVRVRCVNEAPPW